MISSLWKPVILANLFLDSNIKVVGGELNTLSILNKNIFDSELDDNLSIIMHSIDNSSPLITSGNILGLQFSYNYQPGTIGYTSPAGKRYPVLMLYSDGDFDYLNYIDKPSFVIEINPNSTRTIYLPPKPPNFIPPTIIYPENKILPDKIIYNKFYSKPASNSSIYDTINTYQNITLFSDLYDSYDPITNKFGDHIGKLTVFKFIFTKNNQTYTSSIYYYTFKNNEYISCVSIVKNGLDKNGDLTPGQTVKNAFISRSDGYGYNTYFLKCETFKNYYLLSVGYVF